MAYTFDRVMKIGAASLAALTLFSGVRGCVGDISDDRAVDIAMTETLTSAMEKIAHGKPPETNRITVNGVTRMAFMTVGKPVIYRGGTRESPSSPVMLSGKDDICLVGRFKVISGGDNLPFWKWTGFSSKDFSKTVHRNPANHGLQCATIGESSGVAPLVVETVPAPSTASEPANGRLPYQGGPGRQIPAR